MYKINTINLFEDCCKQSRQNKQTFSAFRKDQLHSLTAKSIVIAHPRVPAISFEKILSHSSPHMSRKSRF